MKTFKSLLCTLFLVTQSLALNTATFAQNNSLPAELTEKSSLAETLKWLDDMSFSQARVGLDLIASGGQRDTFGDPYTYSEFAVFSQGFKLIKTDGCTITLRNSDVNLLDFSHLYPDSSGGSLPDFRKSAGNQTKYSGGLIVSLDKFNYKKGKAPYRHTKKADQIDLLGTWRTKFERQGGFFIFPRIRTEESLNDIKIEITTSGQNGKTEVMIADNLTFTFDDLEMSKKFYAAFRQAIKLCRAD